MRSQSQPIAETQAIAAIEQFLLNQRKRKLIADDLQALRTAAKIEYMGDFAEAAAREPYKPPPSPDLPPLTSIAPPQAEASGVTAAPQFEASAVAAPQVDVAPRNVPTASMPSGAALDKGLKGLK